MEAERLISITFDPVPNVQCQTSSSLVKPLKSGKTQRNWLAFFKLHVNVFLLLHAVSRCPINQHTCHCIDSWGWLWSGYRWGRRWWQLIPDGSRQLLLWIQWRRWANDTGIKSVSQIKEFYSLIKLLAQIHYKMWIKALYKMDPWI